MYRDTQRHYQAVIFDMDGLLFDTERTNRWAWNQALKNHGYQMTDEIYLKFIGRDTEHREFVLKQEFGEQFPFTQIFFERVQIGDAREIEQGVSIKAGALSLLQSLKNAKIPVGLATGTVRERAMRRLLSAGLESYFCTVVAREDVAQGKPAPDLFIEASRKMMIPLQSCVVLEDSNSGIESATKAGMCAIMIPDLETPATASIKNAYQIVPSLNEAKQVLQTLLGLDT